MTSRPALRTAKLIRVGLFPSIAVFVACAFVLIAFAPPSVAQQDSAEGAFVTPRLQAALDSITAAGEDGPADGIVEMVAVLRSQVDVAEVSASARATGAESHARGQTLYAALTEHAQTSQASLLAWLDARGVAYRPYYIVNMIEIEGDAAVVEALRMRPEIARLALNVAVEGLDVAVTSNTMDLFLAKWRTWRQHAEPSGALPWGLSFVHAPEVWALGYTGKGIVVASQDTGVQWDHPALQETYRGWDSATMTATHAYNWLDAWGADASREARCAGEVATNPQIPCDDNGHGTHTVGTMVGDASSVGSGILGVAPDAQWIGCRNMSAGVGSPTSYAACFEFFLAPYPQGGDPMTDGDPLLAPHIINNSWSCPVSEGCDDPEILLDVVELARAAGQFVAVSAGNSGYVGCASITTPIAIYDSSFTVGSVDSNGSLSAFSSRGPVTVDQNDRTKPDMTAPGSNIYSTYTNGAYATLSGTSMASPHVAGAVALLWSAVPALVGDIDRTEQILRESATPVPYDDCGASTGADGLGNNGYGAGHLDLLRAVQVAQGSAPSLAVTVVDGEGAPLAGELVRLLQLSTLAEYAATTSADGVARFASISTTGWTGERTMQIVADRGTSPLIVIEAATNHFFPFLPCNADFCQGFAGIPPFVLAQGN